MSASARRPRAVPLSQVWCEFCLTTVLLLAVVTLVRWLRAPASPLYIGDLRIALAVAGPAAGMLVVALILSPWGRRSGGHMNPAVTVAVWLMDVFPGVSVLPYVVAQLAGSVLGAFLGRIVWGPVVSGPAVDYAALQPAPGWSPPAVFLAETGCILVLTLAVGFLLAYPAFGRLLPQTVGACIALTVVVFGPLSGGSANPARQFGPAVLAGQTTDLAIYMLAPVLGAVLGASVHHLLYRRFQLREPLTYKLAGAGPSGTVAR
ncbi:aquaporin [Streptomyces sp. S.PB5]|uniref:MIP/aquaporin family protein n=1 Tax=Streptomyces sp. S.PB5 TaxID=3020844 RepID=UPI0025B0F996|nr:aquaporin [Streptomyces sp. S.PB5]MDN3028536.1 aquaporin [Streptomyces sp. S.PB5]